LPVERYRLRLDGVTGEEHSPAIYGTASEWKTSAASAVRRRSGRTLPGRQTRAWEAPPAGPQPAGQDTRVGVTGAPRAGVCPHGAQSAPAPAHRTVPQAPLTRTASAQRRARSGTAKAGCSPCQSGGPLNPNTDYHEWKDLF
jgi:hypothetical protein